MSAATHARRESPLARLTRLARKRTPAGDREAVNGTRQYLQGPAFAREEHHGAPHGIARPEVLDAIVAAAAAERWASEESAREAVAGPVHMIGGADAIMPCCGLTETQVPRTDFVTANPRLVTCRTAAHDTMPDDRAPHHRPYAPGNEPERGPYVPDLDADLAGLPHFRAAIRAWAQTLHTGCQCELADVYATLLPAGTYWWSAPMQVHEAETAEMGVAA